MALTDHRRDAALATGCKRSRTDRGHLAFEHQRQHIAGRNGASPPLVACVDDEAIRLEADMAAA